MAFSAPSTFADKWPLFVKYGATKSCVYQSMYPSKYDGEDVLKNVKSSHNIEIVFDSIKETLNDESTTRSINKVAIFPALLLSVDPKINDLIVDPDLTSWEVKAVSPDPLNMHYELLVKPIK